MGVGVGMISFPGGWRGEEGSIHPEPSLGASPSPLPNPILLSLGEFTPPWPLKESLLITWEIVPAWARGQAHSRLVC